MVILGVAYKADIDDTRESPALKLIELLQADGAEVSYHDPHVAALPEHGLQSSPLDPAGVDCVVIVTAHSGIDYEDLVGRRRSSSTSATRPARTARRTGRSGSCDRPRRPCGARLLGTEPGAELRRAGRLRWLCDLSPDLLAEGAKAHPNARTTSDFQEMISDPELDAVVIATPVITHYELAKTALEAGKHVFVEKPQAQSSAEAEDLLALAEDRGLVLMPGYLLLYHPALLELKQAVDSGDLGDLLYLYGNRQNLGQIRRDENALWSLGSHDLSMILHLVGEEPVEAWARGESFLRSGIEDVVFCYLRFASGVVAHMHVSWLDPHKMRKLTVVGRDKMAVFDDMEADRKITVYDKGPVQRPAADWHVREGDIRIPKLSREEPLRREAAHFLSLVEGEGDPLAAAREGLAVVRTLELLQESLNRAPA